MMGFFQVMKETPERVKMGNFVSQFFFKAPVEVIDALHMCLGRPALTMGLGVTGGGSGGDIEAKMQVLLKAAKEGDPACERLLRYIMLEASNRYASGTQPIELVREVVALLREVMSRNYVLDGFDPWDKASWKTLNMSKAS